MNVVKAVFDGVMELFNINITLYGFTFTFWHVFILELIAVCVLGAVMAFFKD